MKKSDRTTILMILTCFIVLLNACTGKISPFPSSSPSPSPSPSPTLIPSPTTIPTTIPTTVPTAVPTAVPVVTEAPVARITPVPLVSLDYSKVVSPDDMKPGIEEGFDVIDNGPDESTTIVWKDDGNEEQGLMFVSYVKDGKTYAEIKREDYEDDRIELPAVSRQLAIVSPRNVLAREQVDDVSKLKIFDAGKYYVNGKSPYRMREEAVPYLFEMFAAAEKAGISDIKIRDTFRGFDQQTEMFNWAVKQRVDLGTSYNEAFRLCDRETAYPGTSEHHDGFTADIINGDLKLEQGFGKTVFGKWLAANSYKFGFIIRYPSGKEAQTTKFYEPWHIRFIGPQAAEVIFKYKITLEEFHAYLDINRYLTSSYGNGKPCIFMNASSLGEITIQEGVSESGELIISERGDGGYILQFSID